VRTDPENQIENSSVAKTVECASLAGVAKAVYYAKTGRLITAVKHIEMANSGISREKAKAIVNSFGYGRELRWPEAEKLPVRCL
jgi:hypothetical protein